MVRRRILVLKSAFAFQPEKWRPFSGLRSSVGLAIPIVLAAFTGHTAWGMLAANGALNTALASVNSVTARRVQVMLSVSVTAALMTILAVLVGQNTLLTTLTITLAATLLTLYGGASGVNTSVGIPTTNTLIVLSGLQLPPDSAPLSGLLVLLGGLLQTLLLAVVWPISPRWRERDSVAQTYRSLGQFVARLPQEWAVVPATTALQEAWAALGEARGHGWHPEHAQMRQALRVAEGIRAALAGYTQADGWLRENGHQEQARVAATVLSQVLRQVEVSARRGQPNFAPASEEALNTLLGDIAASDTQVLSEWLHLIQRLLQDLNHAAVTPPQAEETAAAPSVWESLKNIPRPRWELPLTRHAVKYGLVLGVGTLVTRLLHVPHGYWLVLTAAVVLRQDYVTTLTRGVARLGGTLVGVLLAALLIWVWQPGPSELAWWSLVGAFLTFALFPAGYAVFSAALTLYVVFAIAAAGLSEQVVVEWRLALTLGGGLLALCAYLLYPTWQSIGTRKALLDAAAAQREYLDRLGALWRHISAHHIEAASSARNRARTLRLQAEGIVQASLIEPHRSLNAAPDPLPPAQAQAYLQRLNANAALSLSLHARAAQADHTSQSSDLVRATAEADALIRALQSEK